MRESGQGAYPVLQFVLASFGKNAGYGTSLTEALNDVLRSGSITDPETGGSDEGKGGKGGNGQPTTPPGVLQLLVQADQKYTEAQDALLAGDTVKWAKLIKEAEALVKQALAAAQDRAGEG